MKTFSSQQGFETKLLFSYILLFFFFIQIFFSNFMDFFGKFYILKSNLWKSFFSN